MKPPELKIFTGPMFGGKTTRMLAALERYQYQNRSTMLFKPSMDKRYSEEKVVTHKGQEHNSMLVLSGQEILTCGLGADVIAVDEMFMIPGSAGMSYPYSYPPDIFPVPKSICHMLSGNEKKFRTVITVPSDLRDCAPPRNTLIE